MSVSNITAIYSTYLNQTKTSFKARTISPEEARLLHQKAVQEIIHYRAASQRALERGERFPSGFSITSTHGSYRDHNQSLIYREPKDVAYHLSQ